MICSGIDPDTKAITWAVIGNGPVRTGRVEAKGRRAEDRFRTLIGLLWGEAWVWEGCDYVWLERPMVGPNRKAAIDQSMVVGAIRAVLGARGVNYSLVDPAIWKKLTFGTGHATKEEVKAWVMSKYDLPGNLEQDYYDAAAIAAFGRRTFEERST